MIQRQHQDLLDAIQWDAAQTSVYTGFDHFSDNIMQAMQQVSRQEFVPPEFKHHAYDNNPLPIGHGQTISQPYIVALMTQLLQPAKDDVVLEIGTGSGYQTAILSVLVRQVYSLERIRELATAAAEKLKTLGYHNIEVHCADGYQGWQEKAPFDSIIVTAAASEMPEQLGTQLKPGGRMVIPIGLQHRPQQLLLVTKDQNDKLSSQEVLAVSFVPMIKD